MSRRRPRGLRPDEQELWNRVAGTATPMQRSKAAPKLPASTPEKPKQTKQSIPITDFRVGSKAATAPAPVVRSTAGDVFADEPLRMDKRSFVKMKRGKASPEGRIDLHGKTADAARAALTAYVLSAAAQGKRLVLVITGKGRHGDDDGVIPGRKGVLRQSLPHWVSTPPLSQVVLQTTPAHQRHGGSGAFYLYLRRSR